MDEQRRAAGKGCPGGLETCGSSVFKLHHRADWMDEEAWQAVRAYAVARRAHQKPSRFLPRACMVQDVLRAVEAGGETQDSEERRQELLWDVEGLPDSICRLRGAGMAWMLR